MRRIHIIYFPVSWNLYTNVKKLNRFSQRFFFVTVCNGTAYWYLNWWRHIRCIMMMMMVVVVVVSNTVIYTTSVPLGPWLSSILHGFDAFVFVWPCQVIQMYFLDTFKSRVWWNLLFHYKYDLWQFHSF
jgi:hypothetical protein